MRYCPERELPLYAFRPGINPHPNKEGGHQYQRPEPSPTKLVKSNPDFLYAIDLYNDGYFWEAHIFLEAIWNYHKRIGNEADFCKALIKLSAGSLKREINQDPQAMQHFKSAKEIIESIEGYDFNFLNKEELLEVINSCMINKVLKIKLNI
jgi:hypothetical protein